MPPYEWHLVTLLPIDTGTGELCKLHVEVINESSTWFEGVRRKASRSEGVCVGVVD